MDQSIRQALMSMTTGPVLFDEPMARYTSLRVGGSADVILQPQTVEELGNMVLFFRESGYPFLVAGNWTNLLVRDGGYRGAVVVMKALRRIDWQDEDSQTLVAAQAGVSLAELVRLASERSLAGMAFCAGIPGSVGGAVVMNAGAFGNEIKDVLHGATMMNDRGEVRECQRRELSFAYRKLDLPAGSIIVSAVFRLEKGDREAIRRQMDEIIDKRKQKHPLDYPSAGSIFKNPPGQPAGRLIEAAGLKGLQIGGARISEKHGNFIINAGNATASDILALIERIQKEVLAQTGISLETEVRIVGE